MENIMLMDSRKKNIKIIDFGLSNWHSDKLPQTHCGSPEYAAPELFYDGRKYGPEIDLWSLGVILYGMMSGQLPFSSPRNSKVSETEWREKLMIQICRGFTTMHEKKITSASKDCQDLVKRLLQLEPKRRIPIWQIYHHPWIKSTIKIRSSERTLDRVERKIISEEICNATKINPSTVEKELEVGGYGEIAGMFNIISHRIRGNGSVDVFGQSFKLNKRRPEPYRSFLREASLPVTVLPKSSFNRPILMIDKSKSTRKIEDSYKKAVELSAELKNLSLSGNPLRSIIRNENSTQEWLWQNKERKPNQLQIINAHPIECSNVKTTQPLRSILERRMTSSISNSPKDPRWRLSDPGTLLTSYGKSEKSNYAKDNSNQQLRRIRTKLYSRTSATLWADI